MAEGRNPLKRTLEILAGTAKDIGKDYTSNFQDLITDAASIKSTVIQGAKDAKDTFDRMKNGTGPIKGVLNWFYQKEGETDQWDLEDADSDFDAGTNFDTDEDGENKGPGVLNVSDARDLTRGHINSMFKIASKISEAQVANTAEIVSTINSRTSEMVASINNVNSTLMGISKQIDSIAKIVTAGAQQNKRREYDSLIDSNGRLTLGNVFDASKNAITNSNAASFGSALKAIIGSGMVTPEMVARLGFDFIIGDKKFEKLGNQSINQIGGKINDAIGQGISDALDKIISNDYFKRFFGDLKEETRSNNFKGYIRNEYTRDAAVFDGMTRKSIVDVIPGYLKMIHEDLSGNKTAVNDKGQIVAGAGNTWTAAVSKNLFGNGAGDYDFLSGLVNDKSGRGGGLQQSELNTINMAVTAGLVGYMMDNNARMLNKSAVSPNNRKLVIEVSAYLDGYLGRSANEWYGSVVQFLSYTCEDFGRLNKFVNAVNTQYESIHRGLEDAVNNIWDQGNVDNVGMSTRLEAARDFIFRRTPKERRQIDLPISESTVNLYGDATQTRVNGDIMGSGPGDMSAGVHDILSDIRTLLAANVKKNVGTKKYSSIKLSSSAPIVPDMQTYVEENSLDKMQDIQEEREKLSAQGHIQGMKSLFKDVGGSIKESGQHLMDDLGDGEYIDFVRDKAGNIIGYAKRGYESDFVQNTIQHTKNAGNKVVDWAGNAWNKTKETASGVASAVSDKIVGTAQAGWDKAVEYANNLGSSKEAEEDKNTVQTITAAMQMAVQNGAVSEKEKGSIQRLIDTIHDSKLKAKLKRHANTILENSSFETKNNETGKKGIFGKLLGFVGLLVSPVKMIGRLATFLLPKLAHGGVSLLRKVFGNDIKELGYLGGQLKDQFRELKDLRKQYKAEKAERGDQRGMTLGQALSPITQPIGTQLGRFGNWAAEKAGTALGYGMYYGGQLLDKGKEIGGKALDGIGYGLGTAYGWGKQAVSQLGTVAGGVLDVGKNLASGARDAFYSTGIGKRFDPNNRESSGEPSKLGQVKENLGEWAKEKTAGLREFGQGFKLGTIEDFKSGFQEAAGIKKPGSVKIEGVEGEPETYSDQVMAKIYGVLTGQESSVLTKDEEEEEKNEAEQKGDDQSTGAVQQDQNPDANANANQQQQQSSPTGTIKGLTSGGTGTGNGSETGNWGANEGSETGAQGGGGFTEGEGGAAGGDGDSFTGGGSTANSGASGLLKSGSTLMKIGGTVGKIAKILGGMGKIIGKILLKAVLMLSGFKALRKTLGSVIPMITKIISIGLKPLNKIFNFLNKTIKPIIAAIKKVLSTVMEAVSGILSAVFDAIVPILNNIVTPVLNALMPVIDVVLNVLQPLFDVITSVIDVVLVPIGGLFKYVLLPIIKQIGDIMKVVMGILELGFGALMVPLGGILTAVGAIAKLFGGGSSLADSGKQMMSTGAQMVVQGLKDIGSGIMSFVSDVVKTITFQDQSEPEQEIKIENPNARDVTSIGSVMDGYASGDVYNDSHNIQNISNIYGSGRAQGSYGGALSMKDNGCGPMALADAYNRRHGTNVDGLAMASSMAKRGTYEPGRGTSVSSFMNTSAALGSGLRAGGVTQSSLKRATPNNPITLVGSGSDFGTKSGNNHYVNVVGTDKYGGAYVSNPLTGRVDRRSASTLASNSLLGLYGSGDSSYEFEMPDVVKDALSELKNIAGSLLGMFTKSSSDAMTEQMNQYERESKLENIKDQLNQWFSRMKRDGNLPDDYDEETYGDDYYAYVEAEAEKLAFEEFESSHPRKDGETEEAYQARFQKWYTDEKKLKYIGQVPAYQQLSEAIKENGTNMTEAFESFDSTNPESALGSAMASVSSAADSMIVRDGAGGSSSSGGPGSFVETVANIFEGLVKTNPKLEYSNSNRVDAELRSGTKIENIRPDCSGVIGAAIKTMGYDLSGGNMMNLVTYDFDNNKGSNSIILDPDGTPSSDWEILPFDRSQKKAGDVIINSASHMGMFIKRNPDGTGRNYGFDAGNTDGDSGWTHAYTGSRTGGIHGSAKAATNYLDATGSIDKRYTDTIWSQPDIALDGAGTPNFILRYVKPVASNQSNIELTGMLDKHNIWNSYKDVQGVPIFIRAGEAAGMSPAEIATLMSTGIWEDSGQKIFGLKSLDATTYDYNGQAAKGIMNWVDQDVAYGNTVSDQLKWIHGIYFAPGTDDYRAKVRENGYNTQDEAAFKEATGRNGFKLKIGDKYGQYINEDLVEGAAHFFTSALVPEKIHTAKGMAENVGTAAGAYNWMLENGYATATEEESPTGGAMLYPTINNPTDAARYEAYRNTGSYTGKASGRVNNPDGEGVWLLMTPEKDGRQKVRVPNGTTLDFEYVQGHSGWVKTRYKGNPGWMDVGFIEFDKSAIGAPETSTDRQFQTGYENKTTTTTKSDQEADFDIWNVKNYVDKKEADVTPVFNRLAEMTRNAYDSYKQGNSKYSSFYLDTYTPTNNLTSPNEWMNDWHDWRAAYKKYNMYPTDSKFEKAYIKQRDNGFPWELGLLENLYGKGDMPSIMTKDQVSDLGGFANIMSSLMGEPGEVPDVDTDKLAQEYTEGTSATAKSTYVTYSKKQDARLQAILNHKFSVSDERVAELLEMILTKLGDRTPPSQGGTTSTPTLFDNNKIPQAVQRLSKG